MPATGGFAHGTTACLELLLGVFVLFLPTHVGFIGFNRADKRWIKTIAFKCRTQTVRKMPCAFLGNLKITVQLHAGHALEAGCHEIDGDYPNLVTEFGTLHRRSNADAEPLAAFPLTAEIRHGLVLGPGYIDRTAMWTVRTIRPALFNKPLFSGRIVRKHLKQLFQADAFTV